MKKTIAIFLGLLVPFCSAKAQNKPLLHWTFDQVEGLVVPSNGARHIPGKLVVGPWNHIAPHNKGYMNGAIEAGSRGHVLSTVPVPLGEKFTVAFWLKSTSYNANKSPVFVTKDFTIFCYLGYITVQSPMGQVSLPRISGGSWEHVAVSVQPGKVTLTINGVSRTSKEAPGKSYKVEMAEVRIGCVSRIPTRYLGLIDDVRIYDETLTQADITTLATGAYHPKAKWATNFSAEILALIIRGQLAHRDAKELQELGVNQHNKLIIALNNSRTRSLAAMALAAYGSKEMVDTHLIPYLEQKGKEQDSTTRAMFLSGLALRADDAFLPILKKALRSKTWQDAYAAGESLALLNQQDVLVDALHTNTIKNIRVLAFHLEQFDWKGKGLSLARAMVGRENHRVLATLAPEFAVTAILEYIDQKVSENTIHRKFRPEYDLLTKNVLVGFGVDAVPMLIEHLSDNEKVSVSLLWVLNKIKHPSSAAGIANFIEAKHAELAVRSAETLTIVNNPSVVPTLMQKVQTTNVRVRNALADSIIALVPEVDQRKKLASTLLTGTGNAPIAGLDMVKCGQVSGLDQQITPLLNHINWKLRTEAVKALSISGGQRSVVELEKKLKDPEWPVRYYALKALIKLVPEKMADWQEIGSVDSAIKIQHLVRLTESE
ncbi:MAG: hypothetical protein NE330_15190 [Lentisphaeraceae bacterium]|nr:hypothetical protein [Lentisphaeraceae bacterium]